MVAVVVQQVDKWLKEQGVSVKRLWIEQCIHKCREGALLSVLYHVHAHPHTFYIHTYIYTHIHTYVRTYVH
jgi:hypothetical protein